MKVHILLFIDLSNWLPVGSSMSSLFEWVTIGSCANFILGLHETLAQQIGIRARLTDYQHMHTSPSGGMCSDMGFL